VNGLRVDGGSGDDGPVSDASHHDHDHDRRAIDSREEWDRARDNGTLTRQDVEARLQHIAVRDLGRLGSAGYDEDGFMSALVADGLRHEGIGWFKVWPNDHDPPHVHVIPFGHDKKVDLRFSLETGELLDERPDCISSKDVKNIGKALASIRAELGEWWAKGERDPVSPITG